MSNDSIAWLAFLGAFLGMFALLVALVGVITQFYLIRRLQDRLIGQYEERLKSLAGHIYEKIPRIEAAIQEMTAGQRSQEDGRIEQAIGRYQRAVEIYPQVYNGYPSLGYALLAKGDSYGAIDAFGRATSLFPESGEGPQALARAYAYLGQLDLSLQYLAETVRRDPEMAQDMAQDPAFRPLREDPVYERRFAAILARSPGF